MKTKLSILKKASENLSSSMIGEVQSTYKKSVPNSQLPRITSSRDGEKILREIWEADTIEYFECFYVLFTSRSNHVLGWRQISRGGVSGTVADPRIIYQFALLYNACGMVIAHNHPSGNMMASVADMDITKKIVAAGKFLDIQVLYHIIIGENRYLSFADEGIL